MYKILVFQLWLMFTKFITELTLFRYSLFVFELRVNNVCRRHWCIKELKLSSKCWLNWLSTALINCTKSQIENANMQLSTSSVIMKYVEIRSLVETYKSTNRKKVLAVSIFNPEYKITSVLKWIGKRRCVCVCCLCRIFYFFEHTKPYINNVSHSVSSEWWPKVDIRNFEKQ